MSACDVSHCINRVGDTFLCRNHFTMETFGKLSRGNVTINSIELFNYLVRKEWFWQTRITLSLYDQVGDGFLHETVSK